MGIYPTKSIIGSVKGIGGLLLILVMVLIVAPALSPAPKAQTGPNHPLEITVEVKEIPVGYGLRDVLLMNPGDMERFGLKGGETVIVCNKSESGPNDCVTVRVEYGAGVVSGSVMMDISDINALRLSPGDRFLMELTLP